jgi:Spy/CpxP family protein refolding chaperone
MNKPDFDTNWLEKEIRGAIHAATVRIPYHVCRVQLKLYDVLSPEQKKSLSEIARRLNVKIEIVL